MALKKPLKPILENAFVSLGKLCKLSSNSFATRYFNFNEFYAMYTLYTKLYP